jgi:carbamoyltransferase
MLYEQVTDYLGFLHSSDEYKVMALASFGKPTYSTTSQSSSGGEGQYCLEPLRF